MSFLFLILFGFQVQAYDRVECTECKDGKQMCFKKNGMVTVGEFARDCTEEKCTPCVLMKDPKLPQRFYIYTIKRKPAGVGDRKVYCGENERYDCEEQGRKSCELRRTMDPDCGLTPENGAKRPATTK